LTNEVLIDKTMKRKKCLCKRDLKPKELDGRLKMVCPICEKLPLYCFCSMPVDKPLPKHAVCVVCGKDLKKDYGMACKKHKKLINSI
jgi:hypothetical protein